MKDSRKPDTVCIFLIIFLFSVTQVKAQKVELNPFTGYITGTKLSTNLGYLYLNNGLDLGGTADIGLGGGRYAELSFNHMGSYLYTKGSLNSQRICNLSVNHVSLGVMQEISMDSKLTPYGLLAIGLVNYHPTTGDYLSENNVYISLAGGLKVFTTKLMGLRLQARLILPYFSAGTYFKNGIEGKGYDISKGFQAIQGEITAALVFKLK